MIRDQLVASFNFRGKFEINHIDVQCKYKKSASHKMSRNVLY